MGVCRDIDFYNATPTGTCQKCKKRQATSYWANDILGVIHGLREEWCDICCVTEQLRHANEMADKIPTLEYELERLLKIEDGDK